MSDSCWRDVWREWVAAGRPADLPPTELAFLRLLDVTEPALDAACEVEKRIYDAEMRAHAWTLIDMLRMVGCVFTLRDGQPRIRGAHELWEPYTVELRYLRPVIAGILRDEELTAP